MEFRVRNRSQQNRPTGTVAKVLLTLFLSLFALAGLGGLVAMGIDFWQLLGTYGWDRTSCVIERSDHREVGGEKPYRYEVSYRYQVDGVDYRSDTYQRNYEGTDEIATTQRLAFTLPPGHQTHCFVDPDDSSRSILRREPLTKLFWMLIPLVFLAVGGGSIYLVWAFGGTSSKKVGRPSSISRRARKKSATGSKGCLVLFFGIFLLFGLGFFIPFFGLPMLESWSARGWEETPCTIESSGVETHRGDDSTTYSIEVLYSYEVDGREFKADRYDFSTGSDGNYESKREIVEELSPGTRTTCWVDPEDPLSAVVNRSVGGKWFALIPLVFVIVGLGGIVMTLLGSSGAKGRRRGPAAAEGGSREPELLGAAFAASSPTSAGAGTGDSLVLEPSAGPVAKFVGLLFIALFWNGIVSVFLWQVVKAYRSGDPEGCMTLFLIPFVLVGLLLLVSVPHQFMAMFNPRPTLTLRPGRLATGEAATLSWRFRGAAARISRLVLSLEGVESARYRQGTNTYTATETFLERELVNRERGTPLAMGEVQIDIPADQMHSFNGGNNKIVWKIKLSGEIRLWPDISYEFPVEVAPGGVEE